ncbi:hypothetical protein WJX72_002665 [[Myrmecia] bisecta]|uniref:t-SNARE coiled-coil homology domain-containing protein n=1 Tax=[Myrmecia] bisecta TaxID=41462 RepID=A0AAW1QEH1_9CHLO
MPSGLRQDTDVWLKSYEDTKQLANEVVQLIQDRNVRYPTGGPDASRITAVARRKLGSLGTAVDNLRDLLEADEGTATTENEKNRRRDLVTALRARREQMLQSLKRDQNASNRSSLLESGKGSSAAVARETDRTADLDNRGILQMQQHVMREQDAELAELEKTVTSTRHIALTIDQELDLHTSLLGELDEDVEVSHSRLRAAQKRLRGVMKNSGNCKSMLLIVMLMVILTIVIVLGFKILRMF